MFKGWEIDEDDVKDITKVNDNVFIMPEHDVHIRATWTKQAITKTMDGSVHEKATLYKVLQKEAAKGTYAKEYTGAHQDSMDASKSTQKIYHYYGSNDVNGAAILDKNNVLFAGHCWQMIRTTDTGGVKMIYNGEAEDGKCLNTRENHVGYALEYATPVRQTLSTNYYYGTDYTYDSENKLFRVSGTVETNVWNDSTASSLLGKYTCKRTSIDGTCSTLYLVNSYYDERRAYVIPLNSDSHYSQFGTIFYNMESAASEYRTSLAYVGYMYGDLYPSKSFNIPENISFSTEEKLIDYDDSGTRYWYSDTIDYGNINANQYTLGELYQVSSVGDYNNLIGKYTFRSYGKSNTGIKAYYVIGASGTTLFYKALEDGNMISSYDPMILGDSVTDNGDGTYTLNNPISVSLSDWITNGYYPTKYTCNNSSSTCINPRYITSTTRVHYEYVDLSDRILVAKGRNGLNLTDTLLLRKDDFLINSNNYADYKYTCNNDSATCTEENLTIIDSVKSTSYYGATNHYWGSNVTWDGTKYTLVDPIEIENYKNNENLSTHHYLCIEPGTKTCLTVAFIYYIDRQLPISYMNYILLKDGVTTVTQAMEDMLTKNTNDSTIKTGVDLWYKHYMLDYDEYIEDTIFCNDRSISIINGWSPNGKLTGYSLDGYLYFKEYLRTGDLSCTNRTDQFSVSNPYAQLTYKVGLISSPEMSILNNVNARKTGQHYWLISPDNFSSIPNMNTIMGDFYDYNGKFGTGWVASNGDAYGLRPTISLRPGIEYSDGDGSMANPYKVELGE